MHYQDKPEILSERISEYQLEIKSLKAEIEELRKEKVSDARAVQVGHFLEERYKQSQVRFRTIFEQSKMGNKILDSELKIMEVNPALLNILGYESKKDLLNRRILEFAHPDFLEHWHELQKALWENDLPSFSIDTCLVKKDKTTLWCHVTSITFEDDGERMGYTIIEDVSERKSLEVKNKKLYDSQEMLMSLVAHDLKNPNYIINTLSGLVRKSIEKGEFDKALNYNSLIRETCKRTDGIINDLILIGELESGVISKERADLIEVIKEAKTIISSQAEGKGITISFQTPDSKIYADINKEKFSRVLENLLSNAIKFSHKGGEIAITLDLEKSSFLLKVIDRGIGIPQNFQPIIFDRFTKGKRKGTEGEDTTGLGLFISKGIIELHNGKVWLESIPNEGTTIFIRVPF